MWPARAPGQLQRRSLSSWEAPELIRGIRRPASGRLTKLRSPPSARNVATCVGCTSTRLLSARRRMRRPGVRVDREARERVRERSAAHWVPALKTGTTLGPGPLLPKPQPRAESALEALAPVTTFTSAGSGHPTAPQTRKPHYSAVSEALCRTRTGDPFLTIEVLRCLRTSRGKPKSLRTHSKPVRGSGHSSAGVGTLRYRVGTLTVAPSGGPANAGSVPLAASAATEIPMVAVPRTRRPAGELRSGYA